MKTLNLQTFNECAALAEYDSSGRLIEANDVFLKMMGYELSDVKGHPQKMFFASQFVESPPYKQCWEKLLQGQTATLESARITKAGKEIWVTALYSPVLGKDKKLLKVVELTTEAAKLYAEFNVRKNIMNVTSIVSETDLRGVITEVNEKFMEVAKYSRDELIGQPHNIVRHPDMPKEAFKALWATIGKGEIFRAQVKNKAKDGTPYYVDAVIAPIMGDNGKPKSYIGVRYDITKIEAERQNMRGIIKAIDESYIHVEYDMKGSVLMVNKNFQNLLGFSETEVIGQGHNSQDEKFWQELRAGKVQKGIFQKKTKSGQVVWVQSVYSPITDEMGRVYKIAEISTDVTEQQNMIASIKGTAHDLSEASHNLTTTAEQMSEAAVKTSKESQSAAASAQEIAGGVQVVAANIEEMVASIKEISRSTTESSNMSHSALARVHESNRRITELGNSGQQIGEVIKVISAIAQQTNLLALNATIEAARAGDAGRGFAVVASEVKELAKQTAKATESITGQITAIQDQTQQAVKIMHEVSDSVEKLNSLSGSIASALEQQTATTNQISQVVVQSQKGVESIVETIKTVSLVAQESTSTSEETLNSSQSLGKLAEKLSALTQA